MTMVVFLAYRAILAEPRTKAAATDEYSGGGGGGRGDYVPSVDSMNQYALPMGTEWFNILNLCFCFSSP